MLHPFWHTDWVESFQAYKLPACNMLPPRIVRKDKRSAAELTLGLLGIPHRVVNIVRQTARNMLGQSPSLPSANLNPDFMMTAVLAIIVTALLLIIMFSTGCFPGQCHCAWCMRWISRKDFNQLRSAKVLGFLGRRGHCNNCFGEIAPKD